MPKQQQKQNNSDLLRYASLGSQLLVSLGVAVYIGYRADRWIQLGFPLLVWLLPLVVLCMIMYKLLRETSKKQNDQTKL